jgi:hypothetical protein
MFGVREESQLLRQAVFGRDRLSQLGMVNVHRDSQMPESVRALAC